MHQEEIKQIFIRYLDIRKKRNDIYREYLSLENEEGVARKGFLKAVTQAKQQKILTEKEVAILRVRCGQRKTLEETGKIFDVTRERVRCIERKAFEKILSPLVIEPSAT